MRRTARKNKKTLAELAAIEAAKMKLEANHLRYEAWARQEQRD